MKPTSMNSELPAKVQALETSLPATFETELSDLANTSQHELWQRHNQAAIKAYNQLVQKSGLFGEELRSF